MQGEIVFLLKGLILGFSIAAPVGPIGVLCIRRTLQFGRLSGLFSGLGAAVADSCFAMIAAFGLTFVSNFLMTGQMWFRFIGGVFLLYLGWKTFRSQVRDQSKESAHSSLMGDFLSTFFLTITNPMTILAFIAVFAGIGLSSLGSNYYEATMLVLGVFLGSSAWWLLLSEGVTLFRKKVSSKVMLWINHIAGLIIIGFGVVAILSTV